MPNKEFTIYENLCTGLHSAEIVNKSNEKISLRVITDFFNEEHRPSYDLVELLKYNKDFSKKFNVQIDCSETNPPTLIGVQNFMKNFKITFDYINSALTLKW